MVTECSICKTKKSKCWMGCLGGCFLCKECAKDYQDYELQPKREYNIAILMEVYFRRGKGEKISYEELHKEKSGLKFLTFTDLWKMDELNK